jgi:hypothetical protein
MIDMLLVIMTINQQIIKENDHKLLRKWLKYMVNKEERGRNVGKPKWHGQVLEMDIFVLNAVLCSSDVAILT